MECIKLIYPFNFRINMLDPSSNLKRGRAGPKVKYKGNEDKTLKRLLKMESPKSKRARREEIMDSQVILGAAPSRPRRVNSVQKDAFLDRRLNTEAFLLSLEEND